MAASSRRFPLRSSLSARRVLRNLVAFALLYGAGLAAVWGFSLLGVSTLVAFPVFVLGVLIASLETDSGLWGAALGVAYLLSYDFLFTAPLFTLKVLSRTDVAALVIFLVVSLIMGVITHRMSRQVQAAERTACALGRLNRLSVGLLESSTPQAACSFAQEFLTRVLRRPVTITLGEPPVAGSAAARDCYERRSPTGYGEPGWRDATEKYLPLGMKGRLYGVVAIDCSSGMWIAAASPSSTPWWPRPSWPWSATSWRKASPTVPASQRPYRPRPTTRALPNRYVRQRSHRLIAISQGQSRRAVLGSRRATCPASRALRRGPRRAGPSRRAPGAPKAPAARPYARAPRRGCRRAPSSHPRYPSPGRGRRTRG